MANILVTGGTGFIGSALVRKWLAASHHITVLTRRPEKITDQKVAAISSLDQLSDGAVFDWVVNLAGEPIADKRWTAQRKQLIYDSRVGLTNQLNELIARLQHKPSRFISASAIGYYGDQGDKVLDETSRPHDEWQHRLCRDWENAAFKIADHGVVVSIIRFGLVVGPGGGFLKRMLLPFQMGLGGRLGDGQQWMSWIHLDDLLRLIEWVIEHDRDGLVWNGTAPTPVTNREFTAVLAQAVNRPAFFPVPAFVLKVMLGELSGLLLGGQRVLPDRAVKQGFAFHYQTLDRALADVLSRWKSS